MTERAISLPFAFNAAGEVSYTTDEKKIIQDRIVLAVMTRLGERVMRPSFGSSIHDALFDSMESATDIVKQSVAACFAKWFPDLELEDVVASVDNNEGGIVFAVKYRKALQNVSESLLVRTSVLTRAAELVREVGRG